MIRRFLQWLKRPRQTGPAANVQVSNPFAQELTSGDKSAPFTRFNDREARALKDGKCPDCGSNQFLIGPSGGLTTNIQCTKCQAEYNVGIIQGTVLGERIS